MWTLFAAFMAAQAVDSPVSPPSAGSAPSDAVEPAGEATDTPFAADERVADYVSVTTKVTQPAYLTPGSVAVIDRAQIRAMGYRSVGEAVGTLPGIFVTYDLLNYHVGVRGALGGARAGSRLLKVMIDGVPVPNVQSDTYWLGPEFIPMSVVERIEVFRGPASSLYGQGALVGAINVVTRRASYEGELSLDSDVWLTGGALGQLVGAADANASVTGDGFSVTVGAAGHYEDRSGMAWPAGAARDAAELRGVQADEKSVGDVAVPKSAFLRGDVQLLGGRLSGLGVVQNSDRTAEWYDLAPLSHGTRLNLLNWRGALGYERPFGSGFSALVRTTASGGGTLPGDVFYAPGTTFEVERELRYLQGTGTGEVRYDFDNGGFVFGGVDGSFDRHRLPLYVEVDVDSGNKSPREDDSPERDLANIGLYLQGLYPIFNFLHVTGGARVDLHNVYGVQWGARTGVVVPLFDRFSLKALGGVAYKAPSAEQLYTVGVANGDVFGDPTIRPQYLYGGELAAEAFILENLAINATGFVNLYRDALSYVRQGDLLLPRNYNAQNLGGEAALRSVFDLPYDTTVTGNAALSYSTTVTETSNFGGLIEKTVPDNEASPVWMATLRATAASQAIYTRVFGEYRFVGERIPSQSNLREEGVADLTEIPDESKLPAYHLLDVGVGTTPIDIMSTVSLDAYVKVTNVIGWSYAEIGFGGVDVPALGRTVWLTARAEF